MKSGDVILLDQRGIGRSKPNLSRLATENLPLDSFENNDSMLRAFKARVVDAATYFRNQGVDILAYNTIESANDVDDLRKALGAEKLNLVGFSYGTHLGLACIRYHGPNLNRVVLIGTEGPDHTNKLPSTSDTSLKRLASLAAAAPELEGKIPDLVGMLSEVLARLEKQPVTVQITDQRSKKPVELKVGKSGLQFLIMRDLGDTNDLPIFPVWFYTMHRGRLLDPGQICRATFQSVQWRDFAHDDCHGLVVRYEQKTHGANRSRGKDSVAGTHG